MAGAFENWRRYDAERPALMRREMETIAKMAGLSANLFEVDHEDAGLVACTTSRTSLSYTEHYNYGRLTRMLCAVA